jgi:HEAT repeat protein
MPSYSEVYDMFHKKDVKGLIKALRQAHDFESCTIAMVAAGFLGDIGDASAVEPLIAALNSRGPQFRHSNYDLVRAAAAIALGRIGDPRAVGPLLTALVDQLPMVRSKAAWALGKIAASKPAQVTQPGPGVATPDWAPTHVVPPGGMAAWNTPDPSLPPATQLPERLEVVVETSAGLWAQVRAANGWRGWVDGRLLVARGVTPIGAQLVQPLAAGLLNDPDGPARKAAAEALGKIGDPRAVEPLIASLRDADESVRSAAASALGDIGDARAVEPLIVDLKDEVSDVHRAAAEALGQIGDARAWEPLIGALTDEDRDVRTAAAWALRSSGDPRAVEPLIAALKDEWDRTRRAAAQALGEIGDARAVQPLIAALEDQDWSVRWTAAWALPKLGDARAVEPFVAALKADDLVLRIAAAEALETLGWRPDGTETEAAYSKAKGERDRYVQMGALGMDLLVHALKSQDHDTRREAFKVLGMTGDARGVEPLIAGLNDDFGAREAAAEALGKIRDPRAVEPLVAALKGKGDLLRNAAATALGNIGDPRAVEPLIGALRHGWDLGEAAAEALGRIGDARAVEPLMESLDNPYDERVRRAAAEALGRIGDPRALEPLKAANKDKSRDVRQAAAVALSQIGKPAPSAVGSPLACASCGTSLSEPKAGVYGGADMASAFLKSPYPCKSCGTNFCVDCMASHRNAGGICPRCRGALGW